MITYCTRCLYPSNAKPVISFDEEGVCSGCRYSESKIDINWDEKYKVLKNIVEVYKEKAKKNSSPYDCIIPVSGGKDSTFQTYYMMKNFNLNPLLVSFNHTFNTKLGLRNLENLLDKSNCDLIRFTTNRKSTKKIAKYMLEKLGDVTWHYHAGVNTFPIQIAVKYKIPLIIWGEMGFSEMAGMFNQDDMIEFTRMLRTEHDMRGFDAEDLLESNDNDFTKLDLSGYFYPSDQEIFDLDLKGIFLSNFIKWNSKQQTELVMKEWDFNVLEDDRDRTFNKYDKTDDAANGVHDYLKYLKFGYGRATDDASTEIRNGRMTREEGLEMVKKHDGKRPRDLDFILDFLEISEDHFYKCIDHLRDKNMWEYKNGVWNKKYNVQDFDSPYIEKVRLPQKNERTYFLKNYKTKKNNYYNDFKII